MTAPASEESNAAPAAALPALDASFRAVFEAELGFVLRSLQRLGVREADVHDVAQELFLAVHGAFAGWDRARPVRPWLAGFAVRFAANYRRLAWHRGRSLDEEAAVASPRLADRLTAKRLVLHALEALSEDQRVALVLHDFEELTAREIADELGVSPNTVSSRVRLAREAFREAVRALERESAFEARLPDEDIER